MKPLTLIAAALTALVLAATPAIAPGTTAQAKPIMVADCSACAVEQPDTPALPANPEGCGNRRRLRAEARELFRQQLRS